MMHLVSESFSQASIKTENQLIDFSDSIWQDCLDTIRDTGAYIIFYQGGTIENGTHVPGPVSQLIEESGYNTACIAIMALAHFRILIREFFRKDPDIVSEEAPLILLGSKSAMCMIMVRIPNTQGTLQGELEKNAGRTRFIGLREVCNWQTLLPRMLVSMI